MEQAKLKFNYSPLEIETLKWFKSSSISAITQREKLTEYIFPKKLEKLKRNILKYETNK